MIASIRKSQAALALLLPLLAMLLAVRIAVPVGYMPVATTHAVVITLCTGQGAVNMVVEREVPGKPAKPAPAAADHCPFGALATPFGEAAADALLPPWMGAFGIIAFALKTGWIALLAAPPPPAQAPPLSL